MIYYILIHLYTILISLAKAVLLYPLRRYVIKLIFAITFLTVNSMDDLMDGCIYVRNHVSYGDACKMGKAYNIPERDSQYATGELKRGYFESVFQVEKYDSTERLLQNEFREWNIRYDAGTEFYDKRIIAQIEPCLLSHGIRYRKLTLEEIDALVRCNRPQLQRPYTPRKDQQLIVETSVDHFQKHDKGMLVLMCGVGKTLISLWITQALRANTILIGVPNRLLLKQWKEVVCVLFQLPYLIVEGGVEVDQIVSFLEKNPKCIVITTYSSAHKVYDATHSFVFDMKINDEVHHLTSAGMKSEKAYVKMLDIPSVKQLSLTATLKYLEGIDTISNDSLQHFGKIMDKKCLAWAIRENVICDYVIQTIVTNEENMEQQFARFHIVEENDQRLFLSAYAALRSIHDGHSHHLLIYANNKDNSSKLTKFIKLLLAEYFEMDVYYSNYHSDMVSNDQKDILRLFETSTFAIIACVYCLGEGWDFPLLDGVVFAENMTSNIRIVQSALRASRKNKKESTKLAKIILPILNREDWLENNENNDLKKVREVIYQMGLEDETIEQKIKVYRIDIVKQPTPIEKCKMDYFGEYDEELTRNLRLKTTERGSIGTTYEKARTILGNCIKSKEEYFKRCEKDIRLPKEPDVTFKEKFTNWVDYLSIERGEYYELDSCKQKIRHYLNDPKLKAYYLDLSKMCNALIDKDPMFPPSGLWTDFYKVNDLRDIITLPAKKGKGCL